MGKDNNELTNVGSTYEFNLRNPIRFSGCPDQKTAWELLRQLLIEKSSDSDIVVGHPLFDMFDVKREHKS